MPSKTKPDPLTGWRVEWNNIVVPIDDLNGKVEVIPSGCLALDIGLKFGGIPKGYITRLYGRKGTCKTTLCQRLAANALSMGIPVLWIDAETSFVPSIAKANGIPGNDKRFRLWRNKTTNKVQLTYETMSNIIEAWMQDREWAPHGALFIVDTISAIMTNAMLAGDVQDSHVAEVARMNARWFPKLTPLLNETNSTIVFVQQQRAVVGGMTWGDHEAPGGGFALEHYASVEISLKHIKKEETGNRIRFNIKANRLAHGFVEGEFSFNTDYGIDTPREAIEFGVDTGLIEKTGKWLTLTGQKFDGMNAMRQWLMSNPDELDKLIEQIKDRLRNVKRE